MSVSSEVAAVPKRACFQTLFHLLPTRQGGNERYKGSRDESESHLLPQGHPGGRALDRIMEETTANRIHGSINSSHYFFLLISLSLSR